MHGDFSSNGSSRLSHLMRRREETSRSEEEEVDEQRERECMFDCVHRSAFAQKAKGALVSGCWSVAGMMRDEGSTKVHVIFATPFILLSLSLLPSREEGERER